MRRKNSDEKEDEFEAQENGQETIGDPIYEVKFFDKTDKNLIATTRLSDKEEAIKHGKSLADYAGTVMVQRVETIEVMR